MWRFNAPAGFNIPLRLKYDRSGESVTDQRASPGESSRIICGPPRLEPPMLALRRPAVEAVVLEVVMVELDLELVVAGLTLCL